jgi:arginase family enzyme
MLVESLLTATGFGQSLTMPMLGRTLPSLCRQCRRMGIRSFIPDDLRTTTQPLLDWPAGTGCSRVAIHFDVDTVDSNEIVLGLGAEPNGLTSAPGAAHRR